jgi:phosphatidylserine/phosphatidylglycerophosphate/cardiolipin synthase-like enzyme
MPQGQILEHQFGMGLEASEEATDKQQRKLQHHRPILTELVEKSTFSTVDGVFTTHRGEIGVAMTTVDCLAGDNAPLTEIIWTGPANGRFPVRRIDQVLYDLISSAKKRIVLVTFAAHRVHHLCDHLANAVRRGVELTLIVESEGESEGQLTRDAVAAFKNVPATRTHIYYWPIEKRDRNQAGRPGKLHAKCAIIDEIALIGSANLTDDAFNRNMELGMVVREAAVVLAIAEHFQELIRYGALSEVVPGAAAWWFGCGPASAAGA